ncbi:lysophospholipid acyltransferase family protein [Brevibacillus sp. H7]|uniref:lysophospholipid acyltransferase family protein n=1 Tax=Brevibacillus sp. H7 TaxID=3349138 RepID=UPI00380EA382
MVYHIIRSLVDLFLRIRFRMKVEGAHHIPEGSCILAMNHTSNFDPLMVGTRTPRKMYIMAKEELFANRFFAWIITEMGAFPIKRGQADLKSLKHSLKILEEGKIFSIFIEGTRSKTGEMQEPKKGIGFLVKKSGAPVIPTYVYGAKRGWFQPAGVVFGPPVTFDDEADYEEIAAQVMESIQQLSRLDR